MLRFTTKFQIAGLNVKEAVRGIRLALEHWLTACVERSLAELCERVRAACA